MKMQLLNLIDSDKSDIKWRISRYPDGQVHLELLDDIDRKYDLRILCRIRNSDELFLLAQLGNILEQIQVIPELLDIKYLLAARTDRVFELGRQALDLKIVANIVNSLNAEHVRITDVHSNSATKIIKNSFSWEYDWWTNTNPSILSTNSIILFPDEGAEMRSSDRLYNNESGMLTELNKLVGVDKIFHCKKQRLNDGSVGSVVIEGLTPEYYDYYSSKDFYVVDDLSDGGGTFLKLASELKSNGIKMKSLNLIVTHMIQEQGLLKLSSVYDHVYTTNSYEDRSTSNYNNVTIINLLK